jgi:hypothetical protein
VLITRQAPGVWSVENNSTGAVVEGRVAGNTMHWEVVRPGKIMH